MVDVIRERSSVLDVRSRTYIEWQTKVLASFLASLSQSQKSARALHSAAQRLSMTPADAESSLVEPAVGSFEKLGMIFGSKKTPS